MGPAGLDPAEPVDPPDPWPGRVQTVWIRPDPEFKTLPGGDTDSFQIGTEFNMVRLREFYTVRYIKI